MKVFSRSIVVSLLLFAFSGCADPCDKNAHECRDLGYEYLNKYNDSNNIEDALTAHEYLKKGCEGGVAWDCQDIGYIYKIGSYGAIVNYEEAQKYLTRGCDLYNEDACRYLDEVIKKMDSIKEMRKRQDKK